MISSKAASTTPRRTALFQIFLFKRDFSGILTAKNLEATPFGVVFSVSRQGRFLG